MIMANISDKIKALQAKLVECGQAIAKLNKRLKEANLKRQEIKRLENNLLALQTEKERLENKLEQTINQLEKAILINKEKEQQASRLLWENKILWACGGFSCVVKIYALFKKRKTISKNYDKNRGNKKRAGRKTGHLSR